MRFTYILAVAVATTLHASGTALAPAKDSNYDAIANVASADIVHSLEITEGNGGRMLRKVKDNELEEERSFTNFLKYLKTSITKRIPGTHSNKIYRSYKNWKWNTAQMKRQESAKRYAMGG